MNKGLYLNISELMNLQFPIPHSEF